jgi:hypothetical protein
VREHSSARNGVFLEVGASIADRFFSVQPLSDALHFGFKEVAELLRSRGGRVIVSLRFISVSYFEAWKIATAGFLPYMSPY